MVENSRKTSGKKKKVRKTSSTKKTKTSKKCLRFKSGDGVTSTEKRRELEAMESAGGYRWRKLTSSHFSMQHGQICIQKQ